MPSLSSRPIMGAVLMIGSVFFFPLSDGLAKYLSEFHTVLFLVWCRFLVSFLFILPIAFVTDKRQVFLDFKIGWQTLRAVLLTAQVLLFYGALAQVPLADVLGAFFVAPIIAMVLSIVILKEQLNWQKIVAVTLGFIGTIIILRPGGSMEIGMIYAFSSGLLYAFFMILTRVVIQTSPPLTTFTFQSIVGAILLFPFLLVEVNGGWSGYYTTNTAGIRWAALLPEQNHFFLIILMTLFTIAAYILLINALRFAQASTLSPLHYFEWIGAALIGFFFFGDVPDLRAWIGTLFIILGGLCLLNLKMTKAVLKNNRLLNLIASRWSKAN